MPRRRRRWEALQHGDELARPKRRLGVIARNLDQTETELGGGDRDYRDVRLAELQAELATCERLLQTNAVLRRRDYSFVLYPEEMLREFCTQFLQSRPSA